MVNGGHVLCCHVRIARESSSIFLLRGFSLDDSVSEVSRVPGSVVAPQRSATPTHGGATSEGVIFALPLARLTAIDIPFRSGARLALLGAQAALPGSSPARLESQRSGTCPMAPRRVS